MLNKLQNHNLGLLAIRLALALVFIGHGAQKFMNLGQTESFFATLGLNVFFVYLVALVELLGGFAMLLGVFARPAGLLLAIEMMFAITLVRFSAGFLGGYEYELTLLLASLGIATTGPGAYALMRSRAQTMPMQ